MTNLPTGWTEVLLGDLARFVNGATFKESDWGESGHRIVRIQNLTDPTKPYNRTERRVKDDLYVEPGDLLVSWSATLGVFEWAGPDVAVLNQHIFRVIPSHPALHRPFLKHLLRSAIRSMQRHTHGATMKHINRGEFLGTKVPLPPLEEQRRIAAILDKADQLRAKRRAALEHLDSLTQSIFLDMFGDPVENQQGWTRATLGALLESIESGKSPVCLKEPAPFGEWGVLKLGAVSFGRFDPSENKQLPEGTPPEPRHEVRSGDVLFSRKNTSQLVGACVYVDDPPPRLLLSDLIFRLRIADDAGVLPRYLVSALQSSRMKRYVQSLATGAAASMPNISKQKLMKVSLPVPDLATQKRFDRACEVVDRNRNRLTRGGLEIQSLFISLQSRAFRGEL